jgi:hypothetical protein
MSKDTKFLLLHYLAVFIGLNITVLICFLTIQNNDLFALSGILICLSSLILPVLVEILHLLRKIANSQTKDKNHDS